MIVDAINMRCWGLIIGLLYFLLHTVNTEILTPPYFNLAEGKEIIASATCGVNTPGPELYCKLVGANADQNEDINLIQGQVSKKIYIRSHYPFVILYHYIFLYSNFYIFNSIFRKKSSRYYFAPTINEYDF